MNVHRGIQVILGLMHVDADYYLLLVLCTWTLDKADLLGFWVAVYVWVPKIVTKPLSNTEKNGIPILSSLERLYSTDHTTGRDTALSQNKKVSLAQCSGVLLGRRTVRPPLPSSYYALPICSASV